MAGKKKSTGKSKKKAAAAKTKVTEKKVKPKKVVPEKMAVAKKIAKVKPNVSKKKAAPAKKVMKTKAKAPKKRTAIKTKKALVKAKPSPKIRRPPPKEAKVEAQAAKAPPEKVKKPAVRPAKPPAKKAIRKPVGLGVFFKPRSIAVIGASDTQGSVGRLLLETLTGSGNKVKVFPVHPTKNRVLGLQAYKTILKVPGQVDLAIIPTKKEATKKIIDQCGKKKVKALLMAAPNYGRGGEKDIKELRKLLVKYDLKLIGPGFVGLANVDIDLSIAFADQCAGPVPGKGCLISQSIVISDAVLRKAGLNDLGIGKFVSLGQGLDINENDCLAYWGKDKSVDYILLYMDAFSDPEGFIKVCGDVSKKKPVIALKPAVALDGGTTEAARTAGAAISIADSLVCEKGGVITTEDIGDFFNTALGFGKMPIPEGNRMGIVASGNSLGNLALEACREYGLAVPDLQPKIQTILKKSLPRGAHINNPVGIPPGAGPASYKEAIQALVKDPTVDAIIAIYAATGGADDFEVAKIITKAWTNMKSKRKSPKPVYPVWVVGTRVGEDDPAGLIRDKGLPVFSSPLEVVKLVSNITGYKEWLTKPAGRHRRFDVDVVKAERIINRAFSDKREYLDDNEGQELLGCYGIPTVTTVVTGSLIAAKKHAAKLGYPLAIKGTSPGLIHRYEMKVVFLGVATEKEMVNSYQKIESQLKKKWNKPFRIMIQPMVKAGVDLTIGATRQGGYPPMLIFGLGGPYAGSTAAVNFKLVPLTDLDIRALVEESIAFPFIQGGPGYGGLHIAGLVEILARFSQLIDTHREIVAADLNPFRAFPDKRFIALDQFFRIAR